MGILSAFGNEKCELTVTGLFYIEHAMAVPALKEADHSLIIGISVMNKHHPETYQDMLKEARKVDDIWRIDVDETGYFTVKE